MLDRILKAVIRGGAHSDLFAVPVVIPAYTKKDGTRVEAHTSIRHQHPHAPEPITAPAAPASAAPERPKVLPIIEHTTGKGKVLRGIVRQDLDYAKAKAIDPYTFRKDGGYFIRERHLADAAAAAPEPRLVLPADALRPFGARQTPDGAVELTDPATEEGGPSAAPSLATEAAADVARRSAQAAKLRKAANTLAESAEESWGRDRNTNTARRARIAAGVLKNAAADLRLAETMRNLATAIENGEALHLSGVNSKAAVQQLDGLLRGGQSDRLRARAKSDPTFHIDWDEAREAPASPADVMHAQFPRYSLGGYHAGAIVKDAEMLDLRGHAKLLASLRAAADRDEEFVPYADQIDGLRKLAASLEGRAASSKLPAAKYVLQNVKHIRDLLARRNRLEALGITDTASLRRALAEYVIYRGGTRSEDPVQRMERALAGQTGIGVDFFPTPPALVHQLVRAADIKPGMRVLEPSAGKGDIADGLRGAGADVDTVELSSTLRPILDAKGHRVVAHDFNTFTPPPGGYDRIVMNPPFSNGMDAAHVIRAYGMLKPGGRLVAITGEGVHFRQERAAAGFRRWLEHVGAHVEKLPEGSFKSAFRPTGVSTRMVVIDKPADAAPAAVNPVRPLERHYPLDPFQFGSTVAIPAGAEAAAVAHRAKVRPEHAMEAERSFRDGAVHGRHGVGPTGDASLDGTLDAAFHAGKGWRAQHDAAKERAKSGPLFAGGTQPSRFDAAARAAVAGAGGGATVPEIAARWGETPEFTEHMLHAQHGQYAVMPSGEHWMPMEHYLAHADPVEHLRTLRDRLAQGGLDDRLRARMENQAQRLTAEALKQGSMAD